MNMQRAAKKPLKPGHTLDVLLVELERECETVLKLLHQLDVVGLPVDQKEEILGELSAAITHLHEHTRGLDERVISDS